MTQAEIKAHFMLEIINGKFSLNDVIKQIQQYEKEYGANFFADYDVEEKEKPWDEAYLKELRIKCMAGMASKQFILHLAEVSEYVHNNQKNKIRKTRKAIIAAIAAIIVILMITILCLSKSYAAVVEIASDQSALIDNVTEKIKL